MQGRLRKEQLSVEIETECAHCGLALQLTFDSNLNWNFKQRDAHPLLFEPDVDWAHFEAPNIIHHY